MSWFKDWFNSEYYHILYKDRDTKEAQNFIDNLIKNLNIKKNSKIIDIACGKGRHAKYLNQQGMDVIGIDISPESIKHAKKHENPGLKFRVQDMRYIYKEDEFDIATNLFTSLGYFDNYDDEKKAINAMSVSLKKGGLLIIDFMNVEKTSRNLITSEIKQIKNITFNIKRSIKNNHIIKKISFSDNQREYLFTEKVRRLDLITFSKLTSNAGLEITNTFGNYQLEKFDKKHSDRLILICKK